MAVDCETTGLQAGVDEVIAIGAVLIEGRKVLTSEALSMRVKAHRAPSPSSVVVHGLRQQDLQDGIAPDEAMRRLLHFAGARPWVGYHLAFDLAMLNPWARAVLGVPLPHTAIEVASLYRQHLARSRSAFAAGAPADLSLPHMLRQLGLPQWPAHDAVHDATMAALAFVKLHHMGQR